MIPRKYLNSRKYLTSLLAPAADESDDAQASLRRKATDSGLLLATVIAGGGLTVAFVRRRKMATALGVAGISLALAVALGTAMASPPSVKSPNAPPPDHTAKSVNPQLTVEIVEVGNEIVLTLGRDAPKLSR